MKLLDSICHSFDLNGTHSKWHYYERVCAIWGAGTVQSATDHINNPPSTLLSLFLMYSMTVFALVNVPLYPRAYIAPHRPEQA